MFGHGCVSRFTFFEPLLRPNFDFERRNSMRHLVLRAGSAGAVYTEGAVRGTLGLRRRDFADAEFVAGFVSGAKQSGPVFEVGGEDFFDHAARKFGDELV